MSNGNGLYFVLIFIGVIIGYFIAINNCNASINELNDWKVKYAQLNESYNQKIQENAALRIENERLKAQQKQLSDQIASYLIEQAGIDLFGLKKYSIAWDIIKITICNRNPLIIIC